MREVIDKFGLRELRIQKTNFLYSSTFLSGFNKVRCKTKGVQECKRAAICREGDSRLDDLRNCLTEPPR